MEYNNTPNPNRFLVTKEHLAVLNKLVLSGIISENDLENINTDNSSIDIPTPSNDDIGKVLAVGDDLQLAWGKIKNGEVDLSSLNDSINLLMDKNSELTTKLEAINGQIKMSITEEQMNEAISSVSGGFDAITQTLKNTSTELELLKGKISSVVSTSDIESMQYLLEHSLSGLSQQTSRQLQVVAEQLELTDSQIEVLKGQIYIGVDSYSADQMFV